MVGTPPSRALERLRRTLTDRLQALGFLPMARRLRSALLRERFHWTYSGCASPAPTVVKLDVVRSYLRTSGYSVFVETGTYLAGTVDEVSRLGVRCYSIEIESQFHARAQHMLARRKNIQFVLGDSAVELPRLLALIDEPAVFWLDGHYSGGSTGRGKLDTPISKELHVILEHTIKRHVILIDDAREFNGVNGYPTLATLLRGFESHPFYEATVSADIVRITPRES